MMKLPSWATKMQWAQQARPKKMLEPYCQIVSWTNYTQINCQTMDQNTYSIVDLGLKIYVFAADILCTLSQGSQSDQPVGVRVRLDPKLQVVGLIGRANESELKLKINNE